MAENNTDAVKANKDCMRNLVPEMYKQGEDNLYFFIAALSSEENLSDIDACEASAICLRNVKELLDELNIMEQDKRKKLQELIDKSVDICTDRKKSLKNVNK